MEADDLLCSRNARSRTPLVGRAQWKINQPPSLKRERASLEGSYWLLAAALLDRLFEHPASMLVSVDYPQATAGTGHRSRHIDSLSATLRIWMPCASEEPPLMAQATWTASVISSMFDPFSREACV